MLVHIDLDDLERALNEARDLVQKERVARENWVNEDKDEWQRKRARITRILLLRLSEYL